MSTFTHLDVVARIDVALDDGRIACDTGFIPQGDASIVRAVSLLECLSPSEHPSSPGDIPTDIMPPAVAWGILTIADELDGVQRAELAADLRSFIEDGVSDDKWMTLHRAMVGKMATMSFDVLSKLIEGVTSDDKIVPQMNALSHALGTHDLSAIAAAAATIIGHPASGLFTDPAVDEILDRPVAFYMSGSNMLQFVQRAAVWAARAAYGDHAAIRRGMLDLDFTSMVIKTFLEANNLEAARIDVWTGMKEAATTVLKADPTVPTICFDALRQQRPPAPPPPSMTE